MRDIQQELSLCVRARYPIICLLTWEETRAERLVRSIAESARKEMVTWSLSEGFDPVQEVAGNSKDPETVLKHIIDSSQKAIYLLKDFHPFMERELIVRLLRDITVKLKKSYKTVILVSPQLQIPPDLEKDITVFDLPLPTAQELGVVLKKLLEPYKGSSKIKVDLSSQLMEKVIQGTLGLTLKEAENV